MTETILFLLITDYDVNPNNISDVEILAGRLDTIKENTGCTDMYVDGGFHSEDVHKTAEKNGIEIHLTNMSGTEPRKKLEVSAFEIDEESKTITKCPQGYTPTHAGVSSGQTSAHFPPAACADCELKDCCYSKKQKKSCVVRIPLKTIAVSKERDKMKAERKENTSKRAAIEGTNSAMKRTGLDKLKVRGKAKSTIVGGLKAAAQNIKRTIKYLQGGYTLKQPGTAQDRIPVPILS